MINILLLMNLISEIFQQTKVATKSNFKLQITSNKAEIKHFKIN